MQSHLLERDFLCPNCARKIPSLDKLIVDKPMRARVHEYVDQELERSRLEAEKAEKMDREKAAEGGKTAAEGGAGADGDKVCASFIPPYRTPPTRQYLFNICA